MLPLSGGWREPFRLMRTQTRTVLLVSLFQTVYLYGSFFTALTLVRGAEAAIVLGSSPLAGALVAHLMMHDDRLERRTLVSILLGIGGVVLISLATKPWQATGLVEFGGILLLISGSIVSSIGSVVVARQRGALHPIALNSAQMMIGGAVLLAVGIGVEGPPQLHQPIEFYGLLLWLAAVSAVGFSIWFNLLSRVKISRLSIWKFIMPVCGALLTWWLLPSETPTLSSVAGMLLVVSGILVGQVGRRRSAKTPVDPTQRPALP